MKAIEAQQLTEEARAGNLLTMRVKYKSVLEGVYSKIKETANSGEFFLDVYCANSLHNAMRCAHVGRYAWYLDSPRDADILEIILKSDGYKTQRFSPDQYAPFIKISWD